MSYFKIKIRPHQHNRYLYNITLYERSSVFGIGYWKWHSQNDGITDYGVDQHVLFIRTKYPVKLIDHELELEPKF